MHRSSSHPGRGNRIIAHVVVEFRKSMMRPPAGGFCNLTMTLTSQ